MKKTKKKEEKAKNEAKILSSSLRFQTYWKAKEVYPNMDSQTDERLTQELRWIDNCGFTHGFLQMTEIIDMINLQLHTKVGPSKGMLSGSAVAYCLGLCCTDPIKEGKAANDFFQNVIPGTLNVEIRLDPEKRNTAVAVAEQKFGKSMMRFAVPIIKLDNVILEFQRIKENL